jgi:hypothetical protein
VPALVEALHHDDVAPRRIIIIAKRSGAAERRCREYTVSCYSQHAAVSA